MIVHMSRGAGEWLLGTSFQTTVTISVLHSSIREAQTLSDGYAARFAQSLCKQGQRSTLCGLSSVD